MDANDISRFAASCIVHMHMKFIRSTKGAAKIRVLGTPICTALRGSCRFMPIQRFDKHAQPQK